MTNRKQFDVIIVGGSYSGLAAAMALGRSLRNVLVIDSGLPCNRQTPHSHNFLTQDGQTPYEIAALARKQVHAYDTVEFLDGLAMSGSKTGNGFEIRTANGESFKTKKVIFATGVKDIMPDIPGVGECWGISVLHCPYCHGYEVRNKPTGILGNGDYAFEFAALISNWTKDLTLLTNGASTLTTEQRAKIEKHGIKVLENKIAKLEHIDGHLQRVVFKDGTTSAHEAMYTRPPFQQHCDIPEALGCELTEDGYIKVDPMQKTTVPGVFACGDNTARMRSVANAVSMGTTAGAVVNRELVAEEF